MRLKKFRVTDFRSVDDSGWIAASDVTALIGTNESGKTNLLLPLWKLNPAGKDGQIDLLTDAPRKRYNDIRAGDHRVAFVQVVLETDDDLASELASVTGASVAEMNDRSRRVTLPLCCHAKPANVRWSPMGLTPFEVAMDHPTA